MFYSAGIFRTSSLGGSTSSDPVLRRCGWGGAVQRRGKPGYTDVLQQRADILNSKDYRRLKENHVSQVKEFSAFLHMGFPHSSVSNKSSWNAGDPGLIIGLWRSPGEGNGNPLQYSCLGNPMDRRSLAGYSPWSRRVGHNLATKPHMGRCNSLGSLTSFLWYVPQLSGAGILRSSFHSFPQGSPREWPQSDGC